MPTTSTEGEEIDEAYLNTLKSITRADVDKNLIRCPHAETAVLMEEVRPSYGVGQAR